MIFQEHNLAVMQDRKRAYKYMIRLCKKIKHSRHIRTTAAKKDKRKEHATCDDHKNIRPQIEGTTKYI